MLPIAALAPLDSIAIQDHSHRTLVLLELFPRRQTSMESHSVVHARKVLIVYVEQQLLCRVLEGHSVHFTRE